MILEAEADTERFAQEIAPQISGGKTIALNGPLGAGKTTFVRYLLVALDSNSVVSSPTFVLCHEYLLPKGTRVEHWDLYRLANLPEEFSEPPPQDTIRLVEWAEKFPEFSSMVDLFITFSLSVSESGEVVREVVVISGGG